MPDIIDTSIPYHPFSGWGYAWHHWYIYTVSPILRVGICLTSLIHLYRITHSQGGDMPDIIDTSIPYHPFSGWGYAWHHWYIYTVSPILRVGICLTSLIHLYRITHSQGRVIVYVMSMFTQFRVSTAGGCHRVGHADSRGNHIPLWRTSVRAESYGQPQINTQPKSPSLSPDLLTQNAYSTVIKLVVNV